VSETSPPVGFKTELQNGAASLVSELALNQPRVVDLASLASLAVQVEPYLLRRLRLRFLRGCDASLEADLIFSVLVVSTNTGIVEIDPMFLPLLRQHAVRKGWLEDAWDEICAAHRALSATIRLEEEAIYLALQGKPDWRERVNGLLGRAAKAAESHERVARWAYRALQELPSEIRDTDGFWMLAETTRQRLNLPVPVGPIPSKVFKNVSAALGGNGRSAIDVGLLRDGEGLVLSVPPARSELVISAPDTSPVPIMVHSEAGSHSVSLSRESQTASDRIPRVGRGVVTLETLDGRVFQMPAMVRARSFDWGRDQHLFERGPKCILAIDACGPRTVVALAFLKQLSSVLADRTGPDFRMATGFDLIGGASHGAVLAAGLALGHSVDELRDLYLRAAVGKRGPDDMIVALAGGRELDTPDLRTGLAVATKRVDVGRPWLVTNNPKAPYWEREPDGRPGRRNYKLGKLLEASMAGARPTLVELAKGESGLFVDASISPYSNPALALFQLTISKSNQLRWPLGPDSLTIISIGSGTFRRRVRYEDLGLMRVPALAQQALASLTSDAEMAVLQQMQWLGESPQPWVINSEIGTLADDGLPGGKLFRFLRYDVRLDRSWIAAELGLNLSEDDVLRLRNGEPSHERTLERLAETAAEKQIKPSDFADMTLVGSNTLTARKG
jgi:uncharacterized protein